MVAIPKPSAQKKGEEQQPIPDVEVGDEVYFRHPAGGPKTGKIASFGRHGCHVDCESRRLKVRWEHMLGHKRRLAPAYSVVDEGEDGMIVEEPAGRRRYIHDPDTESEFVEKSMMPRALIFGDVGLIMKSIKGGAGLTLQNVTDKAGNQTKRWKKTSKDQPKARRRGEARESGARHGYGTQNFKVGDHVNFTAGDFTGSGEIVGMPGKDGAHIRDGSGRMHQVHWGEITGHKSGGGGGGKPPSGGGAGGGDDGDDGGDNGKKPERSASSPKARGSQKPVPADKFKAAEFAKSHDDAAATEESVLSQFPEDTRDKIKDANERLKSIELSIKRFKKDGDYQAHRAQLHAEIIDSFFTNEKIDAATPKDGQKPTLTLLGGRGGSGKSGLSGRVYDPDNAIVIDPDKIKAMLPEYAGWNAHEVHDEASDIMERIMETARDEGLNLVLDVTMKTAATAVERVKSFKSAGYSIDAHYMHLPRQEAAKRAVGRFLGSEGRYVPVDVILGNKHNEATFDEVRQHADKWSFWDNQVPRGHEPILISNSDNFAAGKPKAEKKSE